MAALQQRQVLGVISNYNNNKNSNKNHTANLIKNKTTSPQQFEIFHEEEENANDVFSYQKKCQQITTKQQQNNTLDKENGRVPLKQIQKVTKEIKVQEEQEEDDVINESNLVMDSSMASTSLNNGCYSPMILDDSTQRQSFQEEEEEEEDDDDDEEEEDDNVEERKNRDNLLISCLDYKDDILKYMKKTEINRSAKSNYLRKQEDITSSMRSILIDWLVEVSEEYRLETETLYLATNYTDRFLSQMSVLRGKLQLVGTAAIYVASKYEEITPPDVSEFVYITDDTYTKKQVLRMEHLLLKVLDFNMTTPTAYCFLQHYLKFCVPTVMSCKVHCLAKYLSELTLIDADTYLSFKPSQIAASALYLAMTMLSYKWTNETIESMDLTIDDDLKACIRSLHKTWTLAPQHQQQAIQDKYKHSRYECVANIDAPEFLSNDLFEHLDTSSSSSSSLSCSL